MHPVGRIQRQLERLLRQLGVIWGGGAKREVIKGLRQVNFRFKWAYFDFGALLVHLEAKMGRLETQRTDLGLNWAKFRLMQADLRLRRVNFRVICTKQLDAHMGQIKGNMGQLNGPDQS